MSHAPKNKRSRMETSPHEQSDDSFSAGILKKDSNLLKLYETHLNLPEKCVLAHNNIIFSHEDYLLNNSDQRLCYPSVVANKPDLNIRWMERVASYHHASAPFSYEINYPTTPANSEVFGFSVQWQYLPFSYRNPNYSLLYCVVTKAIDDYANIICKGDILLKMNDEIFSYKPEESIQPEMVSNKFSKAKEMHPNGCTLRFLRYGALTTNMMISAAEILLFTQEKSTSAKFTSKVVQKGEEAKKVLELTYLDNTMPSSVKKQLQGSRISWQYVPNFTAATAYARAGLNQCVAAATNTSSTPAVVNSLAISAHWSLSTPLVSVNNMTEEEMKVYRGNGGVYKQQNGKFVAIFVEKHDDVSEEKERGKVSEDRVYNLGEFDKEDEAFKAYNKARGSRELFGEFYPSHYLNNNYEKPADGILILSGSNAAISSSAEGSIVESNKAPVNAGDAVSNS